MDYRVAPRERRVSRNISMVLNVFGAESRASREARE